MEWALQKAALLFRSFGHPVFPCRLCGKPGSGACFSRGDALHLQPTKRASKPGISKYALGLCLLFATICLPHLHAAPKGIVGHWPLLRIAGDTAYDVSGNDNHMFLDGAGWETDPKFGKGLLFWRPSENAFRPDSSLMGPVPCRSRKAGSAFTLCAWVFLFDMHDRRPILTKQGSSPDGPTRGFVFMVEYESPNRHKLNLEVFNKPTERNKKTDRTDLNSNAPIGVAQWVHVAASYKYVANKKSLARLYINGLRDTETDSAVGPLVDNTVDLEIGRYNWAGLPLMWTMRGIIRDVRMYETMLTDDEIKRISTESPPAKIPDYAGRVLHESPVKLTYLMWMISP